MSLLGKNITLAGKTQKGKNCVRRDGQLWTVLVETDRVLFQPSQTGPWLFIAPVGKTMDDKSSRWIHSTSDANFIVNFPLDR